MYAKKTHPSGTNVSWYHPSFDRNHIRDGPSSDNGIWPVTVYLTHRYSSQGRKPFIRGEKPFSPWVSSLYSG
ncbi:hypothetical protein [Paenibacillus polymyxa]|uniref:hypothetical protein n=1 Tax=Paenibacillus polymyxa TaxID=1406 RepID=UPI002555E549|nr:hypothetical protein [Paenibacillus polymyxa]